MSWKILVYTDFYMCYFIKDVVKIIWTGNNYIKWNKPDSERLIQMHVLSYNQCTDTDTHTQDTETQNYFGRENGPVPGTGRHRGGWISVGYNDIFTHKHTHACVYTYMNIWIIYVNENAIVKIIILHKTKNIVK